MTLSGGERPSDCDAATSIAARLHLAGDVPHFTVIRGCRTTRRQSDASGIADSCLPYPIEVRCYFSVSNNFTTVNVVLKSSSPTEFLWERRKGEPKFAQQF